MKLKHILLVVLVINCTVISKQPIVVITIPKSGSHLAYKCVELLTGKQKKFTTLTNTPILLDQGIKNLKANEYLVCHLPYGHAFEQVLRKHNAKCILNIRDPRDQVVSFARFIQDFPDQWWFAAENSIDQNISWLITEGSPYYFWPGQEGLSRNISEFYSSFLKWQDCPLFLSTRFEDLVGSKGGGDDKDQLETVKKIIDHLKVGHKNAEVIAQKLYGGTDTFRKGLIGSWKKEFSHEHIQEFNSIAGNLLLQLGYEQNDSWASS